MEASEILAQSVDKSQVPPLHQKRILAFINHFLISSCEFLNEFAANCETKFIELERKMEKVEAALTIIEAKLASVPDVENKTESKDVNLVPTKIGENISETSAVSSTANTTSTNATESVNDATTVAATEPESEPEPEPKGVRACDDVRYMKFFKMVKFGVPPEAVKVKMHAEGLDANILDTPNLLLADGISSS